MREQTTLPNPSLFNRSGDIDTHWFEDINYCNFLSYIMTQSTYLGGGNDNVKEAYDFVLDVSTILCGECNNYCCFDCCQI